ncbi:MAG: RraA family protein [Rhodobacteraceae bacterium]|nr:RraA family protein [Paracoccaceae bacterium]
MTDAAAIPEQIAAQIDAQIDALAAYDTPTICNALELIAPDRRSTGFSIRPFAVAHPALRPVVGHVRTARIRATLAPQASPDEVRAQRTQYYEYIASGPTPSVVVIQDLDPQPGVGAFWGEVNSAVHKGLGCTGAVTNGSFRDIAELAPGFQILGGLVGPSHAWVHVVDFGQPVEVHGMRAEHGDILHADRHGAVVVPKEAVAKLPQAVVLAARREAPILEAARAEGFDIEALKRAMAESSEIH